MAFSLKNKIKHYSTYGLMLFFLMLPFEYPLASLGSQSILKYVGLICMVLCMFDIIYVQKGEIVFDSRIILTLIWVVYAGLSVLWCPYIDAFNHFYLMYMRNALMFIMIAAVTFSSDEVSLLHNTAIAGILLLLLYMFFVPGAVDYSAFQHRLYLVAGDAHLDENYLAALLLIGYTYALFSFFNKKNDNAICRLFKMSFCAICFFYIILTGSRSGVLSAIFVSLLIAMRNVKRAIICLIIAFLVIHWTHYIFWEILPEDILDRFTIDAFTGQTSESGSRLIIWDLILKHINQNGGMIWGFGAGSGEPIVYSIYTNNGAVHNFFLGLILEFGIIGFILFVPIIYYIEKKIRKCDYASFSLIIGCVIIGCFIDLLTTKFFWAIMMLGSMSVFIHNNDEEEPDDKPVSENDSAV